MLSTGRGSVLTPKAVSRLLLGWGGFVGLWLFGPADAGALTTPVLFLLLVAIIAVIVICAFGVLTQAEHLAHRLGDPYGTLVLTLSIVLIEVILISAVMLGPGHQPTIARDSVMAVSMIIMNLVIGIALLVGSTRHQALRPNRAGVSSYLAILAVLLLVAFVLPRFLGDNGAYATIPAIVISVLTLTLYGYFLHRQMGPQRTDFQEVSTRSPHPDDTATQTGSRLTNALTKHRTEVISRAIVLVLTVIPIVLLSHDIATLLDVGLQRLGAPVALSGLLIAAIVFLPETLTAIRAAYLGQMQRVSNLCHGALVSTVGLTIPAVLTIGLLTGQTVVLAESPEHLWLLAVTLFITMASMLGKRATALHGAAHLMTFMLYIVVIFG